MPKYNNDPRDVPEAGRYRITSPATAPFARATPPARARAIPSLDPRSLAPSTRALAPPPVRCSPPRASSRRASRLARRSRAAGARRSRARPPFARALRRRVRRAPGASGGWANELGTSTSRSTRTTGGSSPRAARRDGAAPRAATGRPARRAFRRPRTRRRPPTRLRRPRAPRGPPAARGDDWVEVRAPSASHRAVAPSRRRDANARPSLSRRARTRPRVRTREGTANLNPLKLK